MHVRSNGINAINIEDGDELVAARITNGDQIVFIASHEGMAVRFDENHVRPMGRAAYGVNGINLEEGDYVVGMTVTPKPGADPMWGRARPQQRRIPGRNRSRPPGSQQLKSLT
jgi:DNA gyrase subunit A